SGRRGRSRAGGGRAGGRGRRWSPRPRPARPPGSPPARTRATPPRSTSAARRPVCHATGRRPAGGRPAAAGRRSGGARQRGDTRPVGDRPGRALAWSDDAGGDPSGTGARRHQPRPRRGQRAHPPAARRVPGPPAADDARTVPAVQRRAADEPRRHGRVRRRGPALAGHRPASADQPSYRPPLGGQGRPDGRPPGSLSTLLAVVRYAVYGGRGPVAAQYRRELPAAMALAHRLVDDGYLPKLRELSLTDAFEVVGTVAAP